MNFELARWLQTIKSAGHVVDSNGRKPYMRYCEIKTRQEDDYVFNAATCQVFLDGYTILPTEEYERLLHKSGEVVE